MTIEKLMEEIKQDGICRVELLHQSLQEICSYASGDEESYEQSTNQKMREVVNMILTDDIRLSGDVNAVHNVAVVYARKNYYDIACRILQKALRIKKYAFNVDLLADYLKYSTCFSADDQEQANEYYIRLTSINRKKWNWRAYEFFIDYLVEELECSPDPYEEKIGIILNLANEYKEKFKNKEYADRAYRELADVYIKDDNYIKGEEILKEAVENSSVNMGYPYILYALCQIRGVYKKEEENKNADKESVKKQLKEIERNYNSAKLCMKGETEKVRALKQQIDLLKKWVAIDSSDIEEYEE